MRPQHVHETLEEYQLVDGYDIVLDLQHSHGIWAHDARTGEEFMDAFTCFASWPMGFHHPAMADPEFRAELLGSALIKPANSDLYTIELARFVKAFGSRVTPEGFPHHFWISGGALAVENALKTAFDWKARDLGRTDFAEDVNDLVILHFSQAFHGRSGYTMSLTNTLPDKIGLFPKFDWPRVHNPSIVFDHDGAISNDIEAEERRACAEIEAAFRHHDDKIAAIIIEPMQGEGGDNHFRPEFLQKLRDYADEHRALLIFDEVQTGFFGSGKPWLWQHYGVQPDIIVFGKKTQVCGILASTRIDEVRDNVFEHPSRINSTWGGNLTDMVRCRRFIDIIEEQNLAERVTAVGVQMLRDLRSMARSHGAFNNVRGIGSLIAFSLPDAGQRDKMIAALYDERVLALKSGQRSIRFRLPLIMRTEEADELMRRLEACLPAIARRTVA